MFIKIGEATSIMIEPENSSSQYVNMEMLESFRKTASELKKIAPKAEDFLYFSAVMMHAAEASAINDDGTPKLTVRGEKVEVGWDKSGDTWKWVTNDKTVKAYKNCFIPGTEILMEDGSSKKIENVVVGDYVITHNGVSKKVLKTFITPHDGKVVRLKVKNNQSVVCTDNHPFYHATNSGYKFSEASELKVGDRLLSPVIDTKIDSNLNANRARLLGIYAAEGSFAKKYNKRQSVRFTIGITETKQADLIKDLFAEEFPDCSVHINPEPHRSVIEVTASGNNIAEYFYYHCGEYSHEKKLSKELVFSTPEVKKSFLAGWIDGDGCKSTHNKIIVITTSPHLAHQSRVMLNSLRVGNSLRKVSGKTCKIANNKEYACKDNYRIELYSDSYKKIELDKLTVKYTFEDIKHKPANNFNDNYCTHLLREINSEDYTGNVYNFEVEQDNSYVANGVVVHNCNGDIFPSEELIKAYKKWVGKPLCIDHKSSSVDHVRGFIVDTYYDHTLRRVVALCALDKKSYPDLARKVATGVSNCVSMGTAVGKAICTDCARVARVEADFCSHMKTKSGYGEINVDLNPIELSIVVNGADPKANIKHIIAAANNLNSYVESKLEKIAKMNYSFTLHVNDSEKTDSKANSIECNTDDFEHLKAEMNKAIETFEEIKKAEKDTNDLAFNQSSGTVDMDDTMSTNSEIGLSQPERYASDAQSISNLHKVTASIENKLEFMKISLENLQNSIKNKQEENMSGSNEMNKKGYYQGTEEPTPGQVKYPKDPLNEKLREDGDKHMEEVDTGAVDSLYPGDLERKKLLARASAEERAMKRNSIVGLAKKALEDKKAYFQGGGGVNEPTPGKVKYPIDKLQDELRDSGDKHMVGQKPFPGVGNVNGLHPSPDSAEVSDELKRKQLMNRASLRASFIKAAKSNGTQDLANSAWKVYLGDKLLLTASVAELSGNRSEMLYDGIATKEFGSKLIEKIKVHGADKVRSLVKSAQEAPPAPAPVPAAPAADPGAEVPVDAGKDTGKDGDPKETALELAEKARDITSDLVEAVRALTGEKSEMGEMGADPMAAPLAAAASRELNNMNSIRKDLNSALISEMKKSIAQLNHTEQELNMITDMFDKGSINSGNAELTGPIVSDAVSEAKLAVADGFKLMTSFVKYARGTKAMLKRAQVEADLNNLEADGDADEAADVDLGEVADLVNDAQDSLDEVQELMGEGDDEDDADDGDSDENAADYADDEDDMMSALDSLEDENDLSVTGPGVKDILQKLPDNAEVTVTASYGSKAGRTAMRAKLAAKAVKEDNGELRDMSKQDFSSVLDDAHALSDGDLGFGDLGYVETDAETNKAMLDLAKAGPKVRKDAAMLNKLISEGSLKVEDLGALVAEGLDSAAVAYYKKFYGQVDGGSEFASELVKEHVKAQMEEELNTYKLKMARAYELTNEMVSRGIVHNDRANIAAQVEEIMGYNDENFESLNRIVAKHGPSMTRAAGRLPNVGLYTEAAAVESEDNDWSKLSAALSTSNKSRLF